MSDARTADDWEVWWDARTAALEDVLGESDDVVGHAVIPFPSGVEAGGAADVLFFRKHVPGVVTVTADLIGNDDQVPNDLGNYELMICERDDTEWGAAFIARLAYFTLQARLNPGETMDVRPALPESSTLSAILLLDYARFTVRGRSAGLLLCLGITADELIACRQGRTADVASALKSSGVFPFTDLNRNSVVDPDRPW
ncbi:MAG: suppressor of fused domain protein [Paludisphaera borealis]|uniref:suppressor of fused domain protein n=1 Tax=Paludisphaera borealis TaxID=1387353 RepID=UPI00284E35B1|nr:suppressor of fused domain protein [Paludisphaera borealis]MDR3621234.1 suppressor of fused domain protein [Paludisphaera borealis]